jgi:hypothetical protein
MKSFDMSLPLFVILFIVCAIFGSTKVQAQDDHGPLVHLIMKDTIEVKGLAHSALGGQPRYQDRYFASVASLDSDTISETDYVESKLIVLVYADPDIAEEYVIEEAESIGLRQSTEHPRVKQVGKNIYVRVSPGYYYFEM